MGFKIGSNYFGSATPLTSVGNDEIIQQHKPVSMTDSFTTYKFSFLNLEPCTIKINGSGEIYLRAGQGFSSDYYDSSIYSFVVVTSGVTYNYLGAY